MEFPAKSRSSTDKLFTWDEVKSLLDKEAMRRAEYITRILGALREKYGDQVIEVAAQVIYNIGHEKGALRAKLMQEKGQSNDLPNLANLVSHEIARLYLGNTVEIHDDSLVIREDYCPLIKKWSDMGLPEEQIKGYCSLFDQVDKGMVEGYNQEFVAELTGCEGLAHNGYCGMVVSWKPEKTTR